MKLKHTEISNHRQSLQKQREFAQRLSSYGISFGLTRGIPNRNFRGHDAFDPAVRDYYYAKGTRIRSKLIAKKCKGLFRSVVTLVRGSLQNISCRYKNRKEIKAYLSLSDHYLRDMGMDRQDLQDALITGARIGNKSDDFVDSSLFNPKVVGVSENRRVFVNGSPCANDNLDQAA